MIYMLTKRFAAIVTLILLLIIGCGCTATPEWRKHVMYDIGGANFVDIVAKTEIEAEQKAHKIAAQVCQSEGKILQILQTKTDKINVGKKPDEETIERANASVTAVLSAIVGRKMSIPLEKLEKSMQEDKEPQYRAITKFVCEKAQPPAL